MAQSTDKILEQLIINQMPRSVYNAKKAAGELDPEQVYLPDAAYDDSLGVTDAVPGKTIKVKAVQGGKPTEWETADIYEKPTSGIPKSDLAQSVQTSLAKADTAIAYNSQTLTEEQKSQARTNIGAGQPVFVVNVTATLDDNYTADKTAAEIEAAYQEGCEIVCRMSVPIIGMGSVPVQLPLASRRGRQIFMFAINQTIWTDVSSLIVSYLVTIADDGVSVGQNNTEIYIKPTSGIPKTDLAQSVQDALDRTWNNMEGKPFSEIGEGLKVNGGKLAVDTTDKIEQGNIKPVTSAAVYTVVGNINAILATI